MAISTDSMQHGTELSLESAVEYSYDPLFISIFMAVRHHLISLEKQ
jgi:hypothetical protein